jgi:hypothetical protein
MYMGLLATAVVADMPVGAPPPFASALEPGSRLRTRTSEARPGSAMTTSAVEEPLASLYHNPQKEGLTPT